MPWKLVSTLILLTVFIIFVGFNWGNQSNLSIFGLQNYEDVPIVVTIGFSFIAGTLLGIVYTFYQLRRKPSVAKPEEQVETPRREKKKLWKKKKPTNTKKSSGEAEPESST